MNQAAIILLELPPVVSEGMRQWLNKVIKIESAVLSIVTLDSNRIAEFVTNNRHSLIFTDPIAISPRLIESLRETTDRNVKIIAVYHSALPRETVNLYDDTISIYDTPARLSEIIERTLQPRDSDGGDDERKELSPREKEVVIGIVKGMSNKEIATSLNVSANTVMTHRRNIAAKLKIHSPAGLTIYAIVSKLVKIEEVSGL